MAVEATPTSFGSLGELEDHGERGLVRERHPCSPSHFANPRGDCGRHSGSNLERLTDADEIVIQVQGCLSASEKRVGLLPMPVEFQFQRTCR